MVVQTRVSKVIRRSLLLKIISNSIPKKEDVDSIIELTAGKVIEDLHALSMTLYLVEGNDIAFKYVYFSPSLWVGNSELEIQFTEKQKKLLSLKVPLGKGIVGQVIESGNSRFFTKSEAQTDKDWLDYSQETGFEVESMLTVPLKEGRVIGAIQVLNKEPKSKQRDFSEEDLHYLEEVAKYTATLLFKILDPNFRISEEDTARYISHFSECPLVLNESELKIDPRLLAGIDADTIRKTKIFPISVIKEKEILVIMTNPLDYQNREIFHNKTHLEIEEVKVAPISLIDRLLKTYFAQAESIPELGTDILEITKSIGTEFESDEVINQNLFLSDESSAPIVKLVTRIIEDAYYVGASDIHIEPQEKQLLIRYRIDGICIEKLKLPRAASAAIIARVKIMCDLDIANHRLPQDGRINFARYTDKNIQIDLRVATCPAIYGEKAVLRILDKTKSALPIDSLGYSQENLVRYRRLIQSPYGMILHTGPTGSGKSMTLFSALREIAKPDSNVQTVEDPVEYTLEGINQVQTNRASGLTFARALRSFLRMDPDVILVGEIRDKETASIAVEAALTGHLLLSTLHTNDAPSTIARFTDMEIDPFMISASLIVVCAQRLMRRVCNKCRILYPMDESEKEIFKKALGWSGEIFKANEYGCPACAGAGLRGRIGVHELMENSEELSKAINRRLDTLELKKIAMAQGMKTLHQDSLLKVKEGMSTLTEAISVVKPDA